MTGYKKLNKTATNFIEIVKEQTEEKKADKIQVLIVEPMKAPYAKMIPNTLKAQQEIVGGLIEPVGLDRTRERSVDIMVNEEGLLLELPLNRILAVVDGQEVRKFPFYGTFYIVACDRRDGETIGITDEEVIEYSAMFSGFTNYIID
jgi:hypothetical protein